MGGDKQMGRERSWIFEGRDREKRAGEACQSKEFGFFFLLLELELVTDQRIATKSAY